MTATSRRSLIRALGALLAAPAIVRVGSIMPVSVRAPALGGLLGDNPILRAAGIMEGSDDGEIWRPVATWRETRYLRARWPIIDAPPPWTISLQLNSVSKASPHAAR